MKKGPMINPREGTIAVKHTPEVERVAREILIVSIGIGILCTIVVVVL